MSKSIYQDYSNRITAALKQKKGQVINKSMSESLSGFDGPSNQMKFNLAGKGEDESLFNSLHQLNSITGKKTQYDQRPGAHPDFLNIKELNTTENHYITSMFIDMKGSKALFRKYDPIVVAYITSTIQHAAIHTCWYFDGYIQRYHGDGLFAYFGGRSMTEATSVNNALNAASFFSYFVKNDLKNIFLEQGVENIFTRIGIDLGLNEDVIWHLAGIKDCSEITTCSLHTSLAADMQHSAPQNGIMVGDNVKNYTSAGQTNFSIKKDSYGNEERYAYTIPDENWYYTQWVFNWYNHLKSIPSITSDSDGNLYFKDPATNILIKSGVNQDYLKQQVNEYRPYLK